MIPSLEVWPTKAKEAPSPHEVRLTPPDTNPVFQCLREKVKYILGKEVKQKMFWECKSEITVI